MTCSATGPAPAATGSVARLTGPESRAAPVVDGGFPRRAAEVPGPADAVGPCHPRPADAGSPRVAELRHRRDRDAHRTTGTTIRPVGRPATATQGHRPPAAAHRRPPGRL